MTQKKRQATVAPEEAKGYVTDTSYIFGFFEELLPVNLKYAALLNGYRSAQLDSDFTYMDLGCGNAVTLICNAALYPKAKFYGVDIMPKHIAFANDVKKQAGLSNLELIEDSFENLNLNKLPQFDYVVAHGMMSWLEQNVRDQLRDIVDKQLKGDGLFYVSYNTYPGWAVKTPMLELARYFTTENEDSLKRMHEAIKLMDLLQRGKSAYFGQNPILNKELEELKKDNLHYLAHEYLHSGWEAFYFREMSDYLDEIGLAYAAGFPFRSNFKEFVIPKEFHSFLELQTDNNKLEEFKDFIRNTRFRKDLYVREQDPSPKSFYDPNLYKSLYFSSVIEEGKYEEDVKIGGLTYRLKGEGFKALRELFPRSSYTLDEILEHESVKGQKRADLMRVLKDFLLLKQAIPTSGRLVDKAVPKISKLKYAHPLNQYFCENLLPQGTPVPLVCTATGTTLTSTPGSAIALNALLRAKGKEDKAMKFAKEQAKKYSPNIPVFKDDDAIKKTLGRLQKQFIPRLYLLGVLK